MKLPSPSDPARTQLRRHALLRGSESDTRFKAEILAFLSYEERERVMNSARSPVPVPARCAVTVHAAPGERVPEDHVTAEARR